VLAEGAGIVVLEELEHAKSRGAKIYGELLGYGSTGDAGHITQPDEEGRGAAQAMTLALEDAGCAADVIGYINAHGTGTAANDKTECAAVADVFGRYADDLMISSTKSMHGHLIGGTGAVELLAVIMALRDGVIAPTIGYEEPDPECALDVVPNTAREAQVDVALSNAFAFGGLNAVMALRAHR
ncbi:MAG: beta-ACP synthase, partial [Rhodobacteraceae bacterium]|nr:beta-ACP synthase [Paracoccaceae bacterium]